MLVYSGRLYYYFTNITDNIWILELELEVRLEAEVKLEER